MWALGAAHVIDYTQEDFVRSDQRYDFMLDLVGNRAISDCVGVVEQGGTYVSCAAQEANDWIGPMARLLAMLVRSMFSRVKMVAPIASATRADLDVMRQMIEAGKVTPLVSRCYAKADLPEALRLQGEGHAQGKTVITC